MTTHVSGAAAAHHTRSHGFNNAIISVSNEPFMKEKSVYYSKDKFLYIIFIYQIVIVVSCESHDFD